MRFFPSFSVKDRAAAFELYRRAFGARKISEGTPPDGGDLHITMELGGTEILLGPGEQTAAGDLLNCGMRFDSAEELRAAYGVLLEEGEESKDWPLGSYPWAELAALVTDKFGIVWWLCI